MTTIQNIQTPTIHLNTTVIRKAALAGLALAGTALLVFAASTDRRSSPSPPSI